MRRTLLGVFWLVAFLWAFAAFTKDGEWAMPTETIVPDSPIVADTCLLADSLGQCVVSL